MEWISLLLFIGTLSLIASMIWFDLTKYKFHFLIAVITLSVSIYAYGLLGNQETLNTYDLILKAFGNTTAMLRGIFRTTDISNRINNDVLFLISAYAIHTIGFGYTYLFIFLIFFKNLALKMRFFLNQRSPHFLILADDDKVNFLLQAYEKEWGKKHRYLRKINLTLPKQVLQKKEIPIQYRYRPGVMSFDIATQSLDTLINPKHKHTVIVSLLTNIHDVMRLVEKLNRYYQQHPDSLVKSFIMYEEKQQLPVLESFSQEKQKLRFFSYHQLIAQQLIVEYPLTAMVPPSFIDRDKATLNDVKINYHLFGFGPTNAEIYRHLFVTNQFPSRTSTFFGKELPGFHKPTITYTLYQDPQQTKTSIPRFDVIAPQGKKELPPPPLSAVTEIVSTSFDDDTFLDKLSKSIKKSDDYSIFIIAFDHDQINIRVLQQTLTYLKSRHVTSFHLFVQMIQREFVQTSDLFKHPNVIPFGFGDYGYSLNQIINPVFTKMAKQIQITLNPNIPYESLLSDEKESLLYEAISLRFKLNLMGLDLAVEKKGLSPANFLKRYDPFDDARFHQSHPRAKNDADLMRYKPSTKKLRNLIARQEHLRWSAFQIAKGYSPMSMNELTTLQYYVDPIEKKDARLTSFEGLFDLHNSLISQAKKTFSEADVIYPFFHTMDHLYDIIDKTPYRVVDKVDEKNNQTVELNLENLSVKSNIR